MKKRALSLILAFLMLISLPAAAFAADGTEVVTYTDHRGNKIDIAGGADAFACAVMEFTQGSPWTSDPLDMDPNDILGEPDRAGYSNGKALTLGAGGVIVLEYKRLIIDGDGNDIYVFEVGDQVEATKVEVSCDLETWYYVGIAQGSTAGLDLGGSGSEVPEGLKFKYVRITDMYEEPGGKYPGADIDAVAGLNTRKAAEGSIWANEELEQADMLGLIPEVLVDADLKQSITRAEFAAVCVRLYESITGTKVTPVEDNPFTDCDDPEVLKAYKIGAVNGMSLTTFVPDGLLNREQASTMLTRVYKKVSNPEWTLDRDGEYTLIYTMPPLFADDSSISGWARDSVYFMAANKIVEGKGNNVFAPKNTTDQQTAIGYANATREQALLIAVRMVKNLEF